MHYFLQIKINAWLVPDFGGRFFCLSFGQEKYEFLSRTVSTEFTKNSSNQFFIRISVVGITYIYIYLLNLYSQL